MFEFIEGILKNKEPSKAVVLASGIGYRLTIGLSTYANLPTSEENVLLYLSHIVREDSETLYAFLEKEQRDLFESVITVSGIGPKIGLAMVNYMNTDQLILAISTKDTRILSKVPGIGKKTAERLVMEMHDKMKKSPILKDRAPRVGDAEDLLISDAVNALMNLGYQMIPAQKAVEKAKEESQEEDLGTLITLALKKI